MPIDAPAFRAYVNSLPAWPPVGGDPLPATKCRACYDYHPATVDCLRPVTVQQRRRWGWVLVAVAVVILAWRVS